MFGSPTTIYLVPRGEEDPVFPKTSDTNRPFTIFGSSPVTISTVPCGQADPVSPKPSGTIHLEPRGEAKPDSKNALFKPIAKPNQQEKPADLKLRSTLNAQVSAKDQKAADTTQVKSRTPRSPGYTCAIL